MEFFRVRHFDRLQHYRDRCPPWIKLYNRLLDDYGFAVLPDKSKWHLIGIFLLASRHGNRIPADARWVRKKIGARTPVDLDALCAAGFIEEDASMPLPEPPQSASPERETEQSRGETDGPAHAGACDGVVVHQLFSEEFERFWTGFPTDPLMSKSRALEQWQRLKPADRAAALAALPAFRGFCEGRANYRPVHPWRFLAERRFDGFAAPPPVDAEKIAAAKDRADRLLKRGKYAEKYE